MNKTGIAFALIFALGSPLAVQAADKPPAIYWMSVATELGGGMGMGGMGGQMPSTSEMVMGALLGSAGGDRGAAGGTQRSIWLQLSGPSVPADPKADHFIPPGQNMGESLPLTTPKPGGKYKVPEEKEDEAPEKPKGRLHIYWGCGDTIRPGQPKTLDMATASMQDYQRFFRTIAINRPRGPRPMSGWTYAHWPNEKDSTPVPKDSSLVGPHTVKANFSPEIHFDIPRQEDYLEPVVFNEMKASPAEAVSFKWDAVPNAVGYFAMAMGGQGGEDTVIWVSSEMPHMGWSLMDYLPTNEVRRLIKERVVMAPSTLACQIPKGIFKEQGAMLQFIAYGPDLDLSYPPKPAKPPKGWQPEWVAKVRLKSTHVATLGESMSAGAEGGKEPEQEKKGVDPVKAIKGLFGF